MVKRVGAESEAATVWPSSMSRFTTTPSTGDLMSVRARSISMSRSFASRCRIIASADLTLRLGERDVGLEAVGLGLVRRDLRLGRGEGRLLDIDLRPACSSAVCVPTARASQFGLAVEVALRVGELRLAAVALRLQDRLPAPRRAASDARALSICARLVSRSAFACARSARAASRRDLICSA